MIYQQGRKKLLEIIQKRLKTFEASKFELYIDFPSKIAYFLYNLNEANIPEIGKWSMRNIRKLYRILITQQIND